MIKYLLFFPLIIINLNIIKGQSLNPGLILTFDDYYIENWHSILPILKKYDAKATFFISNPDRLTSKHILLIKDLISAGHEIGSHSYNHINAKNIVGEKEIDQYVKSEITPLIEWLDSKLNYIPTSFAYPNGAKNQVLDHELFKHFNTLRGTSYSLNSSAHQVSYLTEKSLQYGIGIDNSYDITMNDIRDLLINCKLDSTIQIFYAHKPVKQLTAEYQITFSRIDSILEFAKTLDINSYTISQTIIKTPSKPTGKTSIKRKFKKYEYQTNTQEDSLVWHLEPANSGLLTEKQGYVSIKWNRLFKGDVKLVVSGVNDCGQGVRSKPLKIFIE